ncbi:MAG: SUMF1/EgtB/PvdO family nonheme iron enzyme [Pyrinomonadaceae bacterium]
MKMRFTLSLLIVSLLMTTALLPSSASTQEGRGLGVGGQRAANAGRYYALVIGNNAYTSLPRLKTAEADASEVASLLKAFYGFETKLLLNATRGQIMSSLSAYRRTLAPDANLLIYYAGHGVNDKDADKAYWLPVDADRDDNSNWIIADEITTALKVIPAKHVLIVSDSCYSGTLTRGLGESLPRPTEREQFLKRMAAGRSRTLMASGGDEPVADGGGGNHSVFANALLRGLRQMDKPQFTAAELFRYHVEESVAGRANQTPEYNPLRNSGHEAGDFIFVRVKVRDKTVEVAVNAPPSAKVDPAQQELAFWSSIQNSTDAEDFKDYLEKYPAGLYAGLARRRVTALSNAAKPAPVTPPVNSATTNAGGAARPAGRPQQMVNRAGVELVWIPAGSFMMGSENGGSDEKPVHRVTISEGFYMGKYEVTQAQWQQVMGNNPSNFKDDNLPVEKVSWDDAVSFLAKLNAQNDGYTYRLPSEAEWEYAARAGTTGDYAGDLDSMAWYGNNSGRARLDAAEIFRTDSANYYKRITENGGQTHAVGSKLPNTFGLFDMHGNVWEWCQDWYHDSYAGAPTDGSAWLSGGEQKYRVLRGGSWLNNAFILRSAFRLRYAPDGRSYHVGFRVVAVART